MLIELGLLAFALYDLVKRPQVRGGNKWIWAVVIVLIGTIGP
ncbi:MAG: PLDc N-terminal domain-containing protein, partial [Chloroflexi bacterium]|nr:PLDc N-terminal domain-containing protein [Chloroflexota bacterium]